jgi:hypothetical protein
MNPTSQGIYANKNGGKKTKIKATYFQISKQNLTILTILSEQFSGIRVLFSHQQHYLSPKVFITPTEAVHPLSQSALWLPSLSPVNHCSAICLYEFAFSRLLSK